MPMYSWGLFQKIKCEYFYQLFFKQIGWFLCLIIIYQQSLKPKIKINILQINIQLININYSEHANLSHVMEYNFLLLKFKLITTMINKYYHDKRKSTHIVFHIVIIIIEYFPFRFFIKIKLFIDYCYLSFNSH